MVILAPITFRLQPNCHPDCRLSRQPLCTRFVFHPNYSLWSGCAVRSDVRWCTNCTTTRHGDMQRNYPSIYHCLCPWAEVRIIVSSRLLYVCRVSLHQLSAAINWDKGCFQKPFRIILRTPKHVSHLVWSASGLSTAITYKI